MPVTTAKEGYYWKVYDTKTAKEVDGMPKDMSRAQALDMADKINRGEYMPEKSDGFKPQQGR